MNINWTLLARERKLWRLIDEASARRTFFVSLSVTPLYVWLFLFSDIVIQHRTWWVVLVLLDATTLVLRAYMYYLFDYWHGRSPIRWRRCFFWLNVISLLVFSAMSTTLAMLGSGLETLAIVVLGTLLHGVMLIRALAPFRYGVLLLLLTHLGPFLLMGVLGYEHIKWSTLILLGITLVLLAYEGLKLNQFLWREQLLRRDFRQLRREVKALQVVQSGRQHLSHDFLASLSREIRTPMNNVLGMLRLLSETDLSVEQRRMQNIASASGENIVMLIDELLDLSKIIGRNLVLDSAVFNIRQCIDATINLLSPMAYSKNTELTHISDPDIPLRVRGDARRISQVLSNVIGFVIDFTEGGEITVNVHLTPAQVVEGILRIHVSSKNTLIPEKTYEEVQKLLSRHDGIENLSPNHLGLEIARGVIEAMRGSLGFVASGKNGITFWITMHITLSTQQTFQSKTPEVFLNKRVLLIDMTPGLILSITNDLESWGMSVTSIEGYQKALEFLRNEVREGRPFHMALLNMALEYVGSLKLSTLMAQDPLLVNIRQVILCTVTQRGQQSTLRHEEKNWPCLFLTKPFSRGNLYHALLQSFDGGNAENLQHLHEDSDEMQTRDTASRILLVEDNKVNQMVAIGLLEKFGYSAEVSETGRDAIIKMKENRYDLVLMDCDLPDTDGYSVTIEYRRFEEDALGVTQGSFLDHRTAIIALTANVSEGEEARCFAAGMDDYLTKPIQADKMAIRLRTWLEKAPMRTGVIHTQHATKNAQVWSSSQRKKS